jgi:hypothetical protein
MSAMAGCGGTLVNELLCGGRLHHRPRLGNRHLTDHGLGRQQEGGDRRGVLEGRAHHLDGVDDPRGDEVFILLGLGVESLVVSSTRAWDRLSSSPPLGRHGVRPVLAPESLFRGPGELDLEASATTETMAGLAVQRHLGADGVRGVTRWTTHIVLPHVFSADGV